MLPCHIVKSVMSACCRAEMGRDLRALVFGGVDSGNAVSNSRLMAVR
jgi:hypothetical protein